MTSVSQQPTRPRVIASIEARMESTRLPGKILADVQGKPALTRLLRRLQRCRSLDGIILATTTNPKDEPVASWALSEGIPCYRGSEEDVLARVVEAQQQMRSEVVVEICGDMTLLDPELIDFGVEMFLENECAVVTTTCKPSYPVGVDVLVFPLSALEWVAQTVFDPEVREHVSLYFFQHPEKYRILHLLAPRHLRAPGARFVLDYPEDLQFIRAVYSRLEPIYGDAFGLSDILALLEKEPALQDINQRIEEKSQS
jgi:spore coat polysaccharide biosynthesis protein SpsF